MDIKTLSSAVFLAQALLTTSASGQFYCRPGFGGSPSPQVTVVAPEIHHHIRNVYGGEKSRFYAWAEFPNDYKTQIPVINGILPYVNIRCQSGRVTDVWMDYSRGSLWQSNMRGKMVRYSYDCPRPLPRPQSTESMSQPQHQAVPPKFERPIERHVDPVPAPKERNRTPEPMEIPEPAKNTNAVPVPKKTAPADYNNTTKAPDVPQPKQTMQSDEVLSSINDRLLRIQRQIERIDDLSDRMEKIEGKIQSIDDLRKRMDEMDHRWKAATTTTPDDATPPTPKLDGDLRRPSEVETPESDRTKQFPSYGV